MNSSPKDKDKDPQYRCKNCRQILFRNYIHGINNECNSYFIVNP
jgi:hypothetical protein